MKKTLSLLLSLLMILSLAACIRVKTTYVPTEAPSPAVTKAPAPTAEPTAEPVPAETSAPATADASVDPAIANANSQLGQVTSLHVDMKLNMDIEMILSLGVMDQRTPLDVDLSLSMDATKDPAAAHFALSMSLPNQTSNVLVYAVREGEHTVMYYSEDDGATWKKQTDPKDGQLTLSPEAVTDMLSGVLVNVQETGTDLVNGAPAKVYTGTVPGRYLGELLNSVGSAGELSGVLEGKISEELLANLRDIQVTVMIDEATGLPVRYVVDMTDAVQDLLKAVLEQSSGVSDLSAAGITLDIPSAVLDIVLSEFDSVAPIEVPEAALNAPEAVVE